MGVVVVKLTHAIAKVVKIIEVRAVRRATFGTGVAAGLRLLCVVAPATVGSWPHRVSHQASVAFTTAAAVL